MDNWNDIYLQANERHAELLKEAKRSRLLNESWSHRTLMISVIILIAMIVWWVR